MTLDTTDAPTLDELLAELRRMMDRSPIVKRMVREALFMFKELQFNDEDFEEAMAFFAIAWESPRAAMYLSSLGLFLKRSMSHDDGSSSAHA